MISFKVTVEQFHGLQLCPGGRRTELSIAHQSAESGRKLSCDNLLRGERGHQRRPSQELLILLHLWASGRITRCPAGTQISCGVSCFCMNYMGTIERNCLYENHTPKYIQGLLQIWCLPPAVQIALASLNRRGRDLNMKASSCWS